MKFKVPFSFFFWHHKSKRHIALSEGIYLLRTNRSVLKMSVRLNLCAHNFLHHSFINISGIKLLVCCVENMMAVGVH